MNSENSSQPRNAEGENKPRVQAKPFDGKTICLSIMAFTTAELHNEGAHWAEKSFDTPRTVFYTHLCEKKHFFPLGSMKKESRARVGVVVGSGGIKTLASVELFRFLRQENIEVDLLVGCSGGAILAALHASGHTPEDICRHIRSFWNRSLFEKRDWRTLLGLLRLPFGRFRIDRAILDPATIKKTLKGFFGNRRIEDLKPRTVFQATDIATGEGVVLSSGLISRALYASGAQYPFLPPQRIGDQWLVDGAFSSALPIMEAVKRNVDVIIALSPEVQSHSSTGFLDTCLHFFGRCFRVSERSQTSLSIHLHHHEIIIVDVRFDEVINMWNVEKIPVILEAGKKAIERQAGEIKAALQSFSRN